MIKPTSVDIKDMLVSDGIGTFGTDIFIGREPDEPNNCITIYDTGGGEPNAKWREDNPTIQIRVRNSSYESGYDKIIGVRDKLLGRPPETVNTTDYIGIWASSDIIPMERDNQERSIFVTNFRIIREPSVGDHRDNM